MDDLSVATGRPKCHGMGLSGAHDVISNIREETGGERGVVGRSVRSGAAFRSPFAHVQGSWWQYLTGLLAWISLWWSSDRGRKQKEKKNTSVYTSATSFWEDHHGPLSPRGKKLPPHHSPPRVSVLRVLNAWMCSTATSIREELHGSLSPKELNPPP